MYFVFKGYRHSHTHKLHRKSIHFLTLFKTLQTDIDIFLYGMKMRKSAFQNAQQLH